MNPSSALSRMPIVLLYDVYTLSVFLFHTDRKCMRAAHETVCILHIADIGIWWTVWNAWKQNFHASRRRSEINATFSLCIMCTTLLSAQRNSYFSSYVCTCGVRWAAHRVIWFLHFRCFVGQKDDEHAKIQNQMRTHTSPYRMPNEIHLPVQGWKPMLQCNRGQQEMESWKDKGSEAQGKNSEDKSTNFQHLLLAPHSHWLQLSTLLYGYRRQCPYVC